MTTLGDILREATGEKALRKFDIKIIAYSHAGDKKIADIKALRSLGLDSVSGYSSNISLTQSKEAIERLYVSREITLRVNVNTFATIMINLQREGIQEGAFYIDSYNEVAPEKNLIFDIS